MSLFKRLDRLLANPFPSPGAYYQFKPAIDGKIITDYPDRLLLQGKYAMVPLITGYKDISPVSVTR